VAAFQGKPGGFRTSRNLNSLFGKVANTFDWGAFHSCNRQSNDFEVHTYSWFKRCAWVLGSAKMDLKSPSIAVLDRHAKLRQLLLE
jgi:hypothetical protein